MYGVRTYVLVWLQILIGLTFIYHSYGIEDFNDIHIMERMEMGYLDDYVQDCPYNCSDRGNCSKVDNTTCECFNGWGGLYCEYEYKSLSNGAKVTGNLTETDWIYYSFDFNGGNTFAIQLTTTTSDSVLQLYVKLDGPPFWPQTNYYDFTNTSKLNSTSLDITFPYTGVYIIGIYNPDLTHHPSNFTLVASELNTCPNNCSNNGICDTSTGICACNLNYHLSDCSLHDTPLSFNTTYDDSVSYLKWSYYTFSTAQGNNTVTLSMQEKGSDNYLALYVAYSQRPTPTSFNYISDAGTSQHTLTLYNLPYGVYWVGIYGKFKPGDFQITLKRTSACPNSCNSPIGGTCNETSGTCICNSFYDNSDCSGYYVSNMTANNNYTVTLLPGVYAYLHFYVPIGTTEIFLYAQQPDNHAISVATNLTLLALSEDLPSFLNYDDQMTLNEYTNNNNFSTNFVMLNIQENYFRDIYFAVWSNQSIELQLLANSSQTCPNHCSGHGDCNKTSNACVCNTYFTSQPDCSVLNVSMSDNQNYTFNLSPYQWNYFVFYVISANQLIFDVTEGNGTSAKSLSVYVAYSFTPNDYTYQYFSNSPSESFHRIEITGVALSVGYWYMSIYNPTNITIAYTTQVYALSICPNECSSNGECKGGVCKCNPGYVGDDCSSSFVGIASGSEASGVVSAAQWNYYQVKVQGPNVMKVQVNERITVGKVWVFMMKDVLPTQKNSMYRNMDNSQSHDIVVPSVNATGNWYIGCYGSSYLGFNQPQAEYGLIVLLGCDEYKDCSSCIQDPNCGWCANDSENPSLGKCTAGNESRSFNEKCVAWLFGTCDISTDIKQASLLGVLIGIGVGGIVTLALLAAAFWMYRRQRNMEKSYYAPTRLTNGSGLAASQQEDIVEESYYQSFPRGNEK